MIVRISKEFHEFMKTPKIHRLRSCQCLPNTPTSIKECAKIFLTCDLHKLPTNYLPREFDAECFESGIGAMKPRHYYVLVDNCQLQHTNYVPNGGNYGLYAFSLVLQSNLSLINNLDDLQKSVNLQPLFEFHHLKSRNKKQHPKLKKDSLAKFDWISFLYCHQYSEMLDENSTVIANYLHGNRTLLTLCDTYTFENDHAVYPPPNDVIGIIQVMYKHMKKLYKDESQQDKLFAKLSQHFCKAVAGYIFELCLFQEKLNINIIQKAIMKYISLNPSDVGKFG